MNVQTETGISSAHSKQGPDSGCQGHCEPTPKSHPRRSFHHRGAASARRESPRACGGSPRRRTRYSDAYEAFLVPPNTRAASGLRYHTMYGVRERWPGMRVAMDGGARERTSRHGACAVGRGNIWDSSMGRLAVPLIMGVTPVSATGADRECDGATAIAVGVRRLLAGDSGFGVAHRRLLVPDTQGGEATGKILQNCGKYGSIRELSCFGHTCAL